MLLTFNDKDIYALYEDDEALKEEYELRKESAFAPIEDDEAAIRQALIKDYENLNPTSDKGFLNALDE